MNFNHMTAAQGSGKTESRENPNHPAWKLPAGVAYVAPPEERRALRSRGRVAMAKADAGAAAPRPTVQSLSGVPAPAPAPKSADMFSAAVAASSPKQAEVTPKSSEEIKAEAAQAIKAAYARHGWDFKLRVKSQDQWNAEAKAIQSRDGCDLTEAMHRAGFVHPYVSLPKAPGCY